MHKAIQYIIPRALFAAGLIVGLAGGYGAGVYQMRCEAIEREVAHYNQRTGAWEWGQVVAGISFNEKIPDEVYKAANQAPLRKPQVTKMTWLLCWRRWPVLKHLVWQTRASYGTCTRSWLGFTTTSPRQSPVVPKRGYVRHSRASSERCLWSTRPVTR